MSKTMSRSTTSTSISTKKSLNENKIDKLPDPIYKNYVDEKKRLRKFEFYMALFEPTTMENEYYKQIRRSIKPALPSYMYARNLYYKFYQDNSHFYPNLPTKNYKWNKLLPRRAQSVEVFDKRQENNTNDFNEQSGQKSSSSSSRRSSTSTSSSSSNSVSTSS